MAVIVALLAVAVTTVIVATLMQRQTTYVRAVQSQQVRAELQASVRGGLQSASRLLREDGARTSQTHSDGAWAQPIVDTRLADGTRTARPLPVFVGRIEDEQGKYNLRNLISNGALDTYAVDQLRRLCTMVDVAPEIADRIAQRVLISQPGSGNDGVSLAAEDADAQRAAQQAQAPFPRSIDDLRSVQGVDEAVIAKLRPHLTLLPGVTLVNANTASAEVLAVWVPGLGLEQARGLIAQRNGGQWFLNNADFVNRLNMQDLAPNSVRVAVHSDWFTLVGAARLNPTAVMPVRALFARDGAAAHLVWSREGA
ncbi:general secretion pathway protein K [Bordetella ansorpii]|uniref:Type II secretion system protein K n=2 Tax=Bordetella ansorpii TaxID=288768 RepID=A0A157SR59_9BORD|nr:general secretion pathway protein K [Bordetella ansorpii]